MKPKHQRLLLVVVSLACLCAAVLLVMQAFRANIVYFYSPSDIAKQPPSAQQKIRMGGLVKEGSLEKNDNLTQFIISDGAQEFTVRYQGLLPNLFREGQGVIAEGVFDGKEFIATTILAKHDEKYMPKEVVESLKKSGHWQTEYAR